MSCVRDADNHGIVSLFHGPQAPALLDLNTGQLLDKGAKSHGERLAISSVWQEVRWTYESLRAESRRLASMLLDDGVGPGDRVVVLAGNCIEYVQLFFASTAIGAVFVIVNATFTEEEIVEVVQFVEPRAVFIARQIGFRNYDSLLAAIGTRLQKGTRVESKCHLTYIGDEIADLKSIKSFQHSVYRKNGNEKYHDRPDLNDFWGKPRATDVCCIQFTSGTTGARKASMLSHSNLINNASFVGDRLALTEQDVLCCTPPLFHCFGLVCGLLATVAHGSALIIPSESFNAQSVLRCLSDEHCTVIHAVPTMFEAILNCQRAAKSFYRSNLRTGIIAGATLSHKLLQRLSDDLNLSSLLYAFGMTELSAVSFLTELQHSLLLDSSSVGLLMPHTSAKVIDTAGNIVPHGIQGELCVSGYLVHQGYYKNPQKSTELVQQDEQGQQWLHTGDIVSINASGFCTIVGRKKDLIKKGGENIIPKDIEEILMAHPNVSHAAVVGIHDNKWGEAVCVFVEQFSTQDPSLTPKDFKTWMRRQKMAQHKMPDHYFRIGLDRGIPNEMPINASGKVVKEKLRSIAQQIVSQKLGNI